MAERHDTVHLDDLCGHVAPDGSATCTRTSGHDGEHAAEIEVGPELVARATEAIGGTLTYDERREKVCGVLRERFGSDDTHVYVMDLTDSQAVYEVMPDDGETKFFQVDYSLDGDDVTVGTPTQVDRTVSYEKVTESAPQLGRVLESKGTDATGGRIFRVNVIQYGDSRNGRRYPESVIRKASRVYEGAKVYDHHRTEDELRSSTVAGLVGAIRNVEASGGALEGDLHLLPSAGHIGEMFDVSLEQESAGGPPLIGLSHDIQARWRPVQVAGRRLMEATEILSANSVDVVADPAAGGRATRMVAGGIADDSPESKEDTMTIEELLQLIDGATPEQRAQALAGLGITQDQLDALAGGAGGGEEENQPGAENEPAGEERVPAGAGAATESTFVRGGAVGRSVVRMAVEDAGLDARLTEGFMGQLPERFTEADVSGVIEQAKRTVETLEKAGLAPSVPQGEVTQEERDRKVEAIQKMVSGEPGGYSSLKGAFADFTGLTGRDLFLEDVNATILRESYQGSPREGQRASESIETTTWGEALADAMHKQLLKLYSSPHLQEWRKVVSATPPVNDFRSQKRIRIGGYGTLPTVGQGGAYQPLSSPSDEEETYSVTKKGGTEDLTMETIANDDVQAVQRIPRELALSAALTLYRFVFGLFTSNPNLGDGVAWFAAGHNNTDTGAALAQGTLSAGRRKMRQQTKYGSSEHVLGITPRLLLVPPELEETAYQLATSAVAITSSQDATSPNLHQGLEPIVVDIFDDANDWFLVADPSMFDTIEVGFYQGRQDPEMFVQDAPTIGDVFNADKITYKIRHIYSGAPLDHRSVYRGQG